MLQSLKCRCVPKTRRSKLVRISSLVCCSSMLVGGAGCSELFTGDGSILLGIGLLGLGVYEDDAAAMAVGERILRLNAAGQNRTTTSDDPNQ